MPLIFSFYSHLNISGVFPRLFPQSTCSWCWSFSKMCSNLSMFLSKCNRRPEDHSQGGQSILIALLALQAISPAEGGFADFRGIVALSRILPGWILVWLSPQVFLIWASCKSEFMYPFLILLFLTNLSGILLDSFLDFEMAFLCVI